MLDEKCFECAEPASERAHVVPKSRGGTKTVPLCGYCHGLAHDMRRPQDIGTLTREGMERARAAGKILGRPILVPDYVVARIKAARAAGHSYPTIANALNADAVPTAHGGQWHPATVRLMALRINDETMHETEI